MKSIIIYTTEPVPLGQAATNRFFSYAKGLVENGIDTTVVSIKPGLSKTVAEYSGVYNSVPYKILTNKKLWGAGKFFKLLAVLVSQFKLYSFIHEKKNESAQLAVILVSNKFFIILSARLITWLLGIYLYQEKSEFPFLLMSKSRVKRKIIAPLYIALVYKLFDGMIVMTSALEEYFSGKIKKSARLLLFPLTIDFERFDTALPDRNRFDFRYIGYCGSMGGDKDGISDLLDAFALVIGECPEVKLVLVGDAGEKDMNLIRSKILALELLDSVVLFGPVGRDEIPSFLKSAEVLVLARPANLQAAGGFPSKLGEYLASSRPVVVTKVGEIDRYLTHEVHALLCEPGNMKQFADNILNILHNPEKYREMAVKGRELAKRTFDYHEQSHNLERFLFGNHA